MKSSYLSPIAVVLIAIAGCGNGEQTAVGRAPLAPAERVPTVQVGTVAAGASYVADGQVEAVRQTVIAPQVSGRVTLLAVKAGDAVRAGQVLVRIDARAAEQNQAATAAQLAAARAQLIAAERNLERTRKLVEQKFLSPNTLDRVEADQRAAAETVKALSAQTAGAAAQTGWHTIAAPFDAVVASVTTEVGDTAMPGKPLLQLHDPAALRIATNVPAALAARIEPAGAAGAAVAIEIPDAPAEARRPAAGRVTVVAAADPVSHTQLVRIDLPRGLAGLTPGLFARVRLPLAGETAATASRLTVPSAALVTRGDLRAVYVADRQGGFVLRQVRVGRMQGDGFEVLAGLSDGEAVALDPVAAARAGALRKESK